MLFKTREIFFLNEQLYLQAFDKVKYNQNAVMNSIKGYYYYYYWTPLGNH